ncbi:MAG: chemotaxis protein CheW [Gemmatimonadaceae bacterium]
MTEPKNKPASAGRAIPELSRRDRLRTPTELAAILNPAIPHPPEARTRAPDTVASGEDIETASPRSPEELNAAVMNRIRERQGAVELLLFRAGSETFAAALGSIDEAVELPGIQPLPGMSPSMLGVFPLRGTMTPLYSPERTLGVRLDPDPVLALVVEDGARRVAIAVDDVSDVMTLDAAAIGDSPAASGGEILLGVARNATEIIAVIDARALVAACLADRYTEST